MGQKLLQITESLASSQTEEDEHFEDPGFFFIEGIWALRSNFVSYGMHFSASSFITANFFDIQHISHDSPICSNSGRCG